MLAKILKRLVLRDMFPLCLQQNVSNKLFPDRLHFDDDLSLSAISVSSLELS